MGGGVGVPGDEVDFGELGGRGHGVGQGPRDLGVGWRKREKW